MSRSRHTEAQMIGALKQVEAGRAVDANKTADTKEKLATAGAKEQQTKVLQGMGLAEGVTPDMASYASFLQKGGKPEGWAGYKAGQEAAATQPYKIETAKVEAQTKQLLEGYTRPGYAFNPATGQTQLTNQSDYLRSGGQLQAFRPVTEKEVAGDAMLINRLGDVHQKLTEYEQALQKPVSPEDKRNMAALLGTDAKAAGAVSIGGVHVGGLIPMDRINQVFDSGALNDPSSNARDQLIAYRNMREALVGYKTVLSGSSRGSDKQMELLDQAIPIPSITNADYSARALNSFRGNLRVVGQGLPQLPGIKSPQQIEDEVRQTQPNNQIQPMQPLRNLPRNYTLKDLITTFGGR